MLPEAWYRSFGSGGSGGGEGVESPMAADIAFASDAQIGWNTSMVGTAANGGRRRAGRSWVVMVMLECGCESMSPRCYPGTSDELMTMMEQGVNLVRRSDR